MIKLNDVSFTLPSGQTLINKVSCEIPPHEFVVLLGSNGSGKSTLIKLLNRTYTLSSGEILINNQNIAQASDKQFARKVITLTQFVRESLFFDLTIAENAELIATTYQPELRKNFSKKHFLAELQAYLAKFNEKLANSLHEPLHHLSGGEQQILAFALYLKHQPDILLLDEHTSALDPKTAANIMEFTARTITEKKLTCIMTTHNLEFAIQYGDRLLAINNGELVFDSREHQAQRHDKKFLLAKCYD